MHKVEAYIQKARILGYRVQTVELKDLSKYYIVHKSDIDHIVLIPDNVEYTGSIDVELKEDGNVKVIGGSGLTNGSYMFKGSFTNDPDIRGYKFQRGIIDLTELDTSNMTTMFSMFKLCNADEIIFGNFNTSKVIDMTQMFENCRVPSLNLTSFDTRNVVKMGYMFERCRSEFIDLSSFNTLNVTDMHAMFQACEAKELDLKSFNTSRVKSMWCMFQGCSMEKLDLSSFDTHNVENTEMMFYDWLGKLKTNDEKLLNQHKDDMRTLRETGYYGEKRLSGEY